MHAQDAERAQAYDRDELTRADDGSLVKAAKNGDRVAFGLLAQRHQRLIQSVALRVTRNAEDAEDAVQQALLKAMAHLQKFEERSRFSTWLVRITVNESLMLRRKVRQFHEVSISDGNLTECPEFIPDIVDIRPTQEDICSQQERRQLLYSAMRELKPWVRSALRICDLDEHSTQETALILGITVSAVKSRLSRGRRTLRKKLKSHVGPQPVRNYPEISQQQPVSQAARHLLKRASPTA
jgi:RNA polymerase sigma-70 factor (ECF subfamily)